MDARRESEPTPMKNIRRWNGSPSVSSHHAPPSTARRAIVFEAWTKPELLKRWWVRSRLACPCFPARQMFVSGAGTVFVFGTTPPQSPWNSR